MSSLDAVEPTLLTKTRDNANESGSMCVIFFKIAKEITGELKGQCQRYLFKVEA